jgi:S-layer protein
MATIEQLLAAFVAANDGAQPNAATRTTLQTFANLSTSGQVTDAQALAFILNGADKTTSLAVLSYQFFTGKSPTKAGLDYLTNSPTNPNDLNDAYYAQFGIENRYINFAANLGVAGEGASGFAAKYGTLSFAAYVASIYETIIGSAYARAGGIDPAAAIADIISRQAAILATAQSSGMITPGMSQAQIDLALKAATAGYLMGEAVKADVGVYASAANNFLVALVNGNPTYNTDVVATYAGLPGQSGGAGQAVSTGFSFSGAPAPFGPTVSSITFALTAAADTFTGDSLADTFTATDTTLTAGDNLDGAGGTDSLTITAAGALSTPVATIKNIETASIVGADAVTLDTTGWTGLASLTTQAVGALSLTSAPATAISATDTSQLNAAITVDGGSRQTVASSHNTGGTITLGGTTATPGAIVVTSSVDDGASGGLITVNGGTTVSVTQTASNAAGTTVAAESAVTVNGGASTTQVTVIQAPLQAANTAVAAVAGRPAIAAVTGAPGTQAVTAVTGISASSAVADAAGISANGAVSIIDNFYNTTNANHIAAVTLSNYGAGSKIWSAALTSLSLTGTAGTLALDVGPTPNPVRTSLALTVNGLSGGNAITDTRNEITSLNVTATGAASILAAFADTSLASLTVKGDQTFRLSAINGSLTSIAVSESAGFNDGASTALTGFAARGAAATLTTTSSGAITVSLDSTTQSFVGASGVDTIRISSTTDATQTITGGSSSADELIVEGGAYALSAATGIKVTGFEILGVAANVTGTVNLANLNSPSKLHIIGNSTIAFSNAVNNGSLTLDRASTSVTVNLADSNGATDTMTVNLGGATSDTVNFGTVTLRDAGNVGVATVNLVSNGVDITEGDSSANTNSLILTDNGLKTLNFSGTQGLSITTINQISTQAPAITLNNSNTSSFGLLIGTLTDTLLSSLTFTGAGKSVVTTLTAASATSMTIANTGTQMATIGAYTNSANLTSLTLSGNVQIGDGLVGGTGATFSSTNGITIAGATDDAHVKLALSGGAAAGQTNSITLGGGNNVVIDATTLGTVNLTVGTGSNFMTIGGATTNTTGQFNITLGAGTGATYITVGTGGTGYATAANYVITGAQVGDRIIFNTDAAATFSTALASTSTSITGLLIDVDAMASHGVAWASFGGNTYVVESISSTLGASDTTVVKLVGVHTFTAATGGGFLTVAS